MPTTELPQTPNASALGGAREVLDAALGHLQRASTRTHKLADVALSALRHAGLDPDAAPALRRAQEVAARLRDAHIFPTYRTTADEVWRNNPQCSCGHTDCDVQAFLNVLTTPEVTTGA